MLGNRDRRFYYFENPGLVVDSDAARLLRDFIKFLNLSQAKIGFDVTRREHGYQNTDFRKLLGNRVVKEIIAAQLCFVAPASRLFAEELCETGFQRLMEQADPSPLTFDE